MPGANLNSPAVLTLDETLPVASEPASTPIMLVEASVTVFSPTPGGGINITTALLKQNRPLVINFLKGYIEGIHYMIGNKAQSVRIMQKYFQNSDSTTMGYLYDETIQRLARDLRASPESIAFHYEMAALDDPRAKQASEKTFWDSSVIDEIRRSGFIDQLYKR